MKIVWWKKLNVHDWAEPHVTMALIEVQMHSPIRVWRPPWQLGIAVSLMTMNSCRCSSLYLYQYLWKRGTRVTSGSFSNLLFVGKLWTINCDGSDGVFSGLLRDSHSLARSFPSRVVHLGRGKWRVFHHRWCRFFRWCGGLGIISQSNQTVTLHGIHRRRRRTFACEKFQRTKRCPSTNRSRAVVLILISIQIWSMYESLSMRLLSYCLECTGTLPLRGTKKLFSRYYLVSHCHDWEKYHRLYWKTHLPKVHIH